MNYNQYAAEAQGPSKLAIGGVACATTFIAAACTFALTAGHADAALYAPAAVQTATRVAAVAQAPVRSPSWAQAQVNAAEAIESEQVNMIPAQVSGNHALLAGSFSAMMLAVGAALAAAFGYRSETIAMASAAGSKVAPKGAKAAGGQAGVGYRGSTIPGSAPTTRKGKPGYVYKLGLKNGKGNVDEYSPIYNPNEWKSDGDVYEPGFAGLALWAAGFLALLGASGFLIFYTSQV
jgi:photosystem II protein